MTRLPSISLIVSIVLLTGMTAMQVALLWPHWSSNPDLSHGFFTPFVCALLIMEARRHGTQRFLSDRRSAQIASALLALALAGLCVGGLLAAALDWSHALVIWLMSAAFVGFLAAALAICAGDGLRLVPWNWNSITAVSLWILTAPIPPGTYTRLTLGLQLFVSENVVGALHLLGIAATREGNVITLAAATVGVEDACSGIRSLISCVFTGFFLSATLVRRPWSRAVLIAAAPAIAIAMNFVRSLLLTLLANGGIDISGAWHDVTGYAVLAVTALILAGLARVLEQPVDRVEPAPVPTHAARSHGAERLLAGSLAAAAVIGGMFYLNTRPSARLDSAPPELAAILPAASDGWDVVTDDSIYQFRATLQTDVLLQRTYLRRSDDGVHQVTIYIAYWRAGQVPVSLVAMHTPDACWPGSGWTPDPGRATVAALEVDGNALPPAESRYFHSSSFPQHVWFWHLYDGRPIVHIDPYSPVALLKIAWRYGFTHNGDQVFVRVSSNRPWQDFSSDPLMARVFAKLRPLGL